MKHFSTALLVVVLGSPAVAQLTVADSLSSSFVTDLLEGQNLSISNLTVNCPPNAMGHFTGTSEVPISQGLVLTSGTADAIAGPVFNFASGGAMGPGDLDLNAELGGMYPTYDACVLEFDCVPIGDTLLFNFAFGSEEYPEFVGSSFNDVFAIYLSGPGYQPQQNVAALPDGTPVAINNVNTGLNAQYFVDNEGQGGQFVAYDGFTTNLTAFAVVVPGESYHFKTAIADAGDGIFDSGVMLEAFSFRSMGGLSTGLNAATGQPSPMARVRDGQLELAFFNGLQGANAMILDAMGRVVRSFRIAGSSMNVEIASLAAGGYSLRVETPKGPMVRRFAKD
jgi:hypothetical protein